MISVKIETLIDNIVIFENELYFTYFEEVENDPLFKEVIV